MIRAQDWEQATRWVAESVEELVFRRGYHQTILRWMNALPDAFVDRFPVIRIQYAFALSFYPRHREYEAQIYAPAAALGAPRCAAAARQPRDRTSSVALSSC